MDCAQFTGGQLDVEFDQILVDLKPYVIKLPQQSGESLLSVNAFIIYLTTYIKQ